MRLGLAVRKQGTQLLRCPLVLPQATRTAPRRRNAGYRTPTGSQPTPQHHLPCHQPPALRECQGWRCSRRPPAGTCAAATSPNARASWAWAKAQGSVRFRVHLWVQVIGYDCPAHALNQLQQRLGRTASAVARRLTRVHGVVGVSGHHTPCCLAQAMLLHCIPPTSVQNQNEREAMDCSHALGLDR